MNHPYSTLCSCPACYEKGYNYDKGRAANTSTAAPPAEGMQASAPNQAFAGRAMTGKEVIRHKIASLDETIRAKQAEIVKLEALVESLPDKMVPEAEAGLLHVVRHMVIIALALICMCASPALAQDTNTPAVKSDFGASNVLLGFNVGTNGVELTSWLTADVTGQQAATGMFTNAVLTSAREPVVTKTNGVWTISFPAEVKPTEHITTAGDAAKVANQMFDQGVAFGVLAKTRNPDVDDMLTLVKVAGDLFQKQQKPK